MDHLRVFRIDLAGRALPQPHGIAHHQIIKTLITITNVSVLLPLFTLIKKLLQTLDRNIMIALRPFLGISLTHHLRRAF
jgi:hypothetical protein